MNMIYLLYQCFFFAACTTGFLCSDVFSSSNSATSCNQSVEIIRPILPADLTEKDSLIPIQFRDEELVQVVNYIASHCNANIVLPIGPQPLKAKVNFQLPEKITLSQSWDLLHTILRFAGYSLIPKKNYYSIVKDNPKEAPRDPVPMYIGTPVGLLPNTDENILYVYHLKNNKVTDTSAGELDAILQQLLPEPSTYRTDVATNAIIIKGPAYAIKALVQYVISKLDEANFRETIKRIDLQYTNAAEIASLFNKQILASPSEQLSRLRIEGPKPSDTLYFSRTVRIIPDIRRNSILIFGREDAVARVQQFIQEQMDIEIPSGKSLFHVYQLRYLDAEDVKKVLIQVIRASGAKDEEQSEREAAPSQRTAIRSFGEGIIITSDKPIAGASRDRGDEDPGYEYESLSTSAGEQIPYPGTNKLIIAATSDDWDQIRNFLQRIDQPQPQVLLEILIADLTLDDARKLNSIIRNPEKFPFPNGIGFQSAQIMPGIIPNAFGDGADNSPLPQTIGVMRQPTFSSADLFRGFNVDSDGERTDCTGAGCRTIATTADPGATLLSVSDNNGSTWGILQIVNVFDNTKILSHPHVIATHNIPTQIVVGEIRRARGSANLGNVAPVVYIQDLTATTSVNITPRISAADVVNLQVGIGIDDFRGSTDDTKVTRRVNTNATVHSGDILALGGFIRTVDTNTSTGTPLLEKIPLIGWFFKQRSTELRKTSLTVFISPTILQPRTRKSSGRYTKDYLKTVKEDVQAGILFDDMRDPITRWFFRPEGGLSATKIGDEFLAKDQFAGKSDEEIYGLPITQNNESSLPAITKPALSTPELELTNPIAANRIFDKKEAARHIKQLVNASPDLVLHSHRTTAKVAPPQFPQDVNT